MIVIVDYGLGNLGSISNMLKKIGLKDYYISSDKKIIEKASKIILPGVGAFKIGMQNLKDLKLIPTLKDKIVYEEIPTLGICLGMQLLLTHSEEGDYEGLNFIEGNVVKFNKDRINPLRIPHMGWNSVNLSYEDKLYEGLEDINKFYFVHSFYAICGDRSSALSTTEYGFEFDSSIKKNNIYGVQFHPEKSHKFGMQLLQNFVLKV